MKPSSDEIIDQYIEILEDYKKDMHTYVKKLRKMKKQAQRGDKRGNILTIDYVMYILYLTSVGFWDKVKNESLPRPLMSDNGYYYYDLQQFQDIYEKYSSEMH